MRIAFTWRIRPEGLAEYIHLHSNVPLELQAAIRESGFSNYSVHLLGHRCFGYFETDGDAASCFDRLGKFPVFQEWERLNAPLQEEEAIEGCGERFAYMEEIAYVP